MSSLPADVRPALAERFPGVVPAEGDVDADGVVVPADLHVRFAEALKGLGFTLYVTVVGSHYPGNPERLEVATVLRRPRKGGGIARWRVKLGPGEEIASLFGLFEGADWQEREQYDLLGIRFRNHPDLRRLMMPEDWEGFPLRKEYAIDTPHAPWR